MTGMRDARCTIEVSTGPGPDRQADTRTVALRPWPWLPLVVQVQVTVLTPPGIPVRYVSAAEDRQRPDPGLSAAQITDLAEATIAPRRRWRH